MSHFLNSKDIGSVTAYGDALTGGYEGSKETFYSFILNQGEFTLPINPSIKPGECSMYISDGQSSGEVIQIPTFDESIEWDGTQKTAQFTNYNPETMTVTGNTGTDAGDYTAIFTPKSGYVWTDGGRWSIKVSWSISQKIVEIPALKSNLVYDGTEQDIIDSTYDPNFVSVSGNKGTNAGDYTVTISLVDNVNSKWNDDSTEDIVETWVIGKAQGFVILSSDFISLNDSDRDSSVNVSGSGDLSVESDKPSFVSASIQNNVIAVHLEQTGEMGMAVITVNVSESANYLSASDIVKIGVNLPNAVSWHDGTDEEIVALVNAADLGIIDLGEYANWKVGDSRNVSLSAMSSGLESHVAQTVEFVLMNKGGKTLVTPVESGRTECSFVVGMKDVLKNGSTAEMGYMNSGRVNTNGWYGSNRRVWCNGVFKNAMPLSLIHIFKEHKNITAKKDSTKEITNDYFALASEKEIFGSCTYSNSTAERDNIQFEYYKTADNRHKYGARSWYWSRSMSNGNKTSFCCVNNGNFPYTAAASDYADNKHNISVFGVI